MTDTAPDVAAIRAALAQGPTPGKWAFSDKNPNGIATVACCEHIVIGPDFGEPGNACYGNHSTAEVDAAYIAACHPERIARLLDALEAATRDAQRYRWLKYTPLDVAAIDAAMAKDQT